MSNKSNDAKIISPIISKLEDKIKFKKKEAVSKFWRKFAKLGPTIFEKIEVHLRDSIIDGFIYLIGKYKLL